MGSQQDTVRVIVNGCNGNMGRIIAAALRESHDLRLVGQTGRNDDLSTTIASTHADVVVDFTHPSVAYANAMIILQSGACAVIGTTGLTEEQRKEVDLLAQRKRLSVLVAPNFCIGAVLMMRFAAEAAKYLPHVEIVEYHHNRKADAPSGTALYTAEYINSLVGTTKAPEIESKEVTPTTPLGAKVGNIRVHSIRLPGFVASQEVILGGQGNSLKIRHDSIDRESFVPGILLAIRTIRKQVGLVYGLENLL